MKKFSLFSFLLMLCAAFACAQGAPLRISILGDSYSTYDNYVTPDTNLVWYHVPENPHFVRGNDVVKVEQTWWHQVIKGMKAELEVNNSYSGSTICFTGYKDKNGVHADYSDRSFVTRDNKLGNPDVILVCGGTNDSWAGSPIGEYVFGNWTKDELYNYRPALAKLFFDLRGNYPAAKIVFLLNSELSDAINESTHVICKHYAVPCIDLVDVEKQLGHPSQKGMKAIAEQTMKFLRK